MGFSARDCPITAEFLLAFRREFGEVTVQYMKEGNVEHGAPSTGEYVQPVIPDNTQPIKNG